MEEFKYQSTTFTDSMSLYEHIITFKNAEDGDGDGDFAIIIKYNDSKDLIELVDHLKEYYGDYNGDGWLETVMDYIWSGGWLVTEEQEKIHQGAYDYWQEKVGKEESN
jgi:hypothetical protein